MNLHLVPAYGREYKLARLAIKDFEDNKDFIDPNGQLINKEQILALDISHVTLRYGNLRNFIVISVKP